MIRSPHFYSFSMTETSCLWPISFLFPLPTKPQPSATIFSLLVSMDFISDIIYKGDHERCTFTYQVDCTWQLVLQVTLMPLEKARFLYYFIYPFTTRHLVLFIFATMKINALHIREQIFGMLNPCHI